MTALRAFAVLAAAFLVGAVALGSMLPPAEPLGQILAGLDETMLPRLQAFELRYLGVWAWQGVTAPLLERPSWLVPLALGIVCVGAVTTLNWLSPPRRRRRS